MQACGFVASTARRSRGCRALCALRLCRSVCDGCLAFGTASRTSCWSSRIRRNNVVCLPLACISTTRARFWRCKFRRDARGNKAKSKRLPDSSSSSSSKLPDLRRDDLTVARAGGEMLGAGVPRSESPKLPPRRRRGLASPGEARGVACAVGVDCCEDMMVPLCAVFAGRSLRSSAFAVL